MYSCSIPYLCGINHKTLAPLTILLYTENIFFSNGDYTPHKMSVDLTLYYSRIHLLNTHTHTHTHISEWKYYHGTSATTFGLLKISAALCRLFVGIGSPAGVYASQITYVNKMVSFKLFGICTDSQSTSENILYDKKIYL